MTRILQNSIETRAIILKELLEDRPVALPTETVYGLAANAISGDAVAKIFQYKERPSFDPLIVHVSDKDRTLVKMNQNGIIDSGQLSEAQFRLSQAITEQFWPGPLTILLPKGDRIPAMVTSNLPEVAVRCPDHPLFQDLLNQLSFPLAAPSANKFGMTSPTCPEHVVGQKMSLLSYVLDGGDCAVGVESTVIRVLDAENIEILRPGGIDSETLERFGRVSTPYFDRGHLPHAPGMLDRHYAPSKEAFRFSMGEIDQLVERETLDHCLLLLTKRPPNYEVYERKFGQVWFLSEKGSDEEAARNIFKFLHDYSNSEFKTLFVEIPSSKSGLWRAIADKIQKATLLR